MVVRWTKRDRGEVPGQDGVGASEFKLRQWCGPGDTVTSLHSRVLVGHDEASAKYRVQNISISITSLHSRVFSGNLIAVLQCSTLNNKIDLKATLLQCLAQ